MVATYTSVILIHHKYTLYYASKHYTIIRSFSSQHMRQGQAMQLGDMIQNDMAPTWDMASVRFAAPLISLSMHIRHPSGCMASS